MLHVHDSKSNEARRFNALDSKAVQRKRENCVRVVSNYAFGDSRSLISHRRCRTRSKGVRSIADAGLRLKRLKTEVFLSSSDAIMIVIFLDLAVASAPRSSGVAKVLGLKQVLPAAAVLKRHGCFRRATNRATKKETGKATTRPAAVARGAWNLLKAPSCACLANYNPKPNLPVELYQGAEWLWYL